MRTLTLLALFAVAIAITGCGKNTEQSVAPEIKVNPDAPQGPDKDRFQGVWRLDSRLEVSESRRGWVSAEGNNARFQFVGDTMSRRESVTDPGELFAATWEPEKNPKLLTLVPIGADSKPQPGDTKRWIYKFEGDTLIIAYGFAPAPPPDFHPDPNDGVIVLRLRKTDEQPVLQPAKSSTTPK